MKLEAKRGSCSTAVTEALVQYQKYVTSGLKSHVQDILSQLLSQGHGELALDRVSSTTEDELLRWCSRLRSLACNQCHNVQTKSKCPQAVYPLRN